MTLFRANTDVTQLATPTSHNEKLVESPAASSTLDNAYPFPAQAGGRRSSQFLEYIQKGPERVEPEGLLKLDLPAITSPLGDLHASPVASAAPESIQMSRMTSGAGSTVPASTSYYASQQPKSLDLNRAASPEPVTGADSFRRRSASTAALMDNAATFLDPTLPKADSGNTASNTSSAGTEGAGGFNPMIGRSQSQGMASGSVLQASNAGWNGTVDPTSHEPTFSNPMAPTASTMAGAMPMAKSLSHQDQLQHNLDAVYANAEPYAERRPVAVQQSPLPSPSFGPVKTVSGGQSSAVMQARRSLALRRSDQPAVPWTNPGAPNGASAHKRASSAEAQPRVRAMSVEELEARHRAKLAALQAPATQTVQEADALRRAKEEWERKQRSERRRMQEREAQKLAAAAAAAAGVTSGGSALNGRVASPVQGNFDLQRISSNGSRDDRRRSRNLSATLLEAVGEETRESGGVNKAAEWRKSISGLDQLDPRAAKPSNPATPISTRPTSPQPTSSGLERISANPFPAQPQEGRKRLSETDRRRLSQGAGDRSSRRYSQPLLDFDLPQRKQ